GDACVAPTKRRTMAHLTESETECAADRDQHGQAILENRLRQALARLIWIIEISGGAKCSNVAMAIETSANSYHATSASL
ncbi:MAG: hypothetical protein ACP5M0_13640, partial [Desulfomonilaceae bacterium]